MYCNKKVQEIEESGDDFRVFLRSVRAKGESWMIDIEINERHIPFKIDTGADVTVMPHNVFKGLETASKLSMGPECSPLDVVSVTGLQLKRGDIIQQLHTASLGQLPSANWSLSHTQTESAWRL